MGVLRFILLCGFFLFSWEGAHAVSCASVSVFSVPVPVERSLHFNQSLANMTRDAEVFLLQSMVDPLQGEMRFGAKEVQIPCAAVPLELRGEMELLSQMPRYSDVITRLRKWSGSGGYNAFSFLRHRSFTLPETVSDLENELGFFKWPHEVISFSVVKGTTRVLYRSPFGSPRLSIAQTVEKDTRYVRETEMIVEREDGSGNFDFYAYDSSGKITTESLFKTSTGKNVVGAVPYTCMSCHYDGATRKFQLSPLSFHH